MSRRMALNKWYKLRWQILDRDKYTCQYCGQAAPDAKLEVDHKVALVDGGMDDPTNLITSCWACNQGKEGLRQSIILSMERKKYPKEVGNIAYRQIQVWNLLKNSAGLTTTQVSRVCSITPNNAHVVLIRLYKKGSISKQEHIWNAVTPSPTM